MLGRFMLAATLSLVVFSARAQDAALPFVPLELGEAVSFAEREDKVVMLVFGTEYCAPCRRLEREVFSDPTVRGYLEDQVVALYVDLTVRADGGSSTYIKPTHGRIGEYYGVTGFPVAVFASAEAEQGATRFPIELSRIVGIRYTSEDGWLDFNLRSGEERARLQALWEELSDATPASVTERVQLETYFSAIKEHVALARTAHADRTGHDR